jgi:hypothetical protein
MAYVRSNLNEIVAEMPGVQAHVRAQAYKYQARIKAAIVPISRTGNLFDSVVVERAFKGKDYWIYIEASYAVPVNYGFKHNWTGDRIRGRHFLKAAIYG